MATEKSSKDPQALKGTFPDAGMRRQACPHHAKVVPGTGLPQVIERVFGREGSGRQQETP